MYIKNKIKYPWFLVSIKEILIKHWQTGVRHCESKYLLELKYYHNNGVNLIYNKWYFKGLLILYKCDNSKKY